MKTKDIIEGLSILEKYRDTPDGYNCSAEHDVLHAYATDKPVEQPDLDRLIELGWRQEVFAGADDDVVATHYDPMESWYCFT